MEFYSKNIDFTEYLRQNRDIILPFHVIFRPLNETQSRSASFRQARPTLIQYSWRKNLHFYFSERISAEITQPFSAENNLFLHNKILAITIYHPVDNSEQSRKGQIKV